MKRVILIITILLSYYIAQGQYQNVEKLPQKLRDSILVEVANKTISKYSTGYLRPGAVPLIEDLGVGEKETDWNTKEYFGIHFFAVYYKGTPEEHEFYRGRPYLVKVFIRADNCRAVTIKYIDQGMWLTTYLDQEEIMNQKVTSKKRFTTIEEMKRIRESMGRTIITDTMSEYWKKFDERVKQMRDSAYIENKRYNERLRQAMKEKQRADSLKTVTVTNA